MRWLDLSDYGAALRVNIDALNQPVLYVLNEGDGLATALDQAGFHRRPTGLWFRKFRTGDLVPVLCSLLNDLPLARITDMSIAEIGLKEIPEPRRTMGPEAVAPGLEALAPVENVETAADAVSNQASGHPQQALERPQPVPDNAPEEEPRTAMKRERCPEGRLEAEPTEPAPLTAEAAGNPDPDLAGTLAASFSIEDCSTDIKPRARDWRLPLFRAALRKEKNPAPDLRREPSFGKAEIPGFEVDWVVSTTAREARELTGYANLPDRCHLVAKLRNPADAAYLRRLPGTRVATISNFVTEIQLIAVVDGDRPCGFGSENDILVVGDAGEGFGATVLPHLLETDQAA